jgi:uroporphyrinogen III methyltransferase/synthase
LIRLARQGRSVCRLKGGDPFVFGRGGEEAEALRKAGIAFEVVPGITAGIAAAAYAGIPVTHRGEAVGVCLVTAHEDPTKDTRQVDWQSLGTLPYLTVAAYMPVANLQAVAAEMIAGGVDPRTPAAVVERATLPGQRTVAAPLEELADKVKAVGLGPPALFLVGKSVALGEHLAWRPERPLCGKRVIVTRPGDQASKLIDALQELGIDPLVCSTIKTVSASGSELVPLFADLDGYDWLFFTSENGVRYFFSMLRSFGKDVRALGSARLAAVGSTTADRLSGFNLNADFVPTTFRTEAMLTEFLQQVTAKGLRVLRVRGDTGPATLEDGLKKAGAHVDCLVTYHTRPATIRQEVQDTIASEGVDAITFTSGSSVESFEALLPGHQLHGVVPAVCIGPVSAEAAKRLGWRQVVTARKSTVKGLVKALTDLFNGA